MSLLGINVRYIYSACILTETSDIKILHDPWFTEGVYDGSWYHFPRVEEPISSIGDCDAIYVSHIHPDHYDPVFLKQYFNKYGKKDIFIANHSPNYLEKKMKGDGLSPLVLERPHIVGDTEITILPHKTGSISDIDSAIIIKKTEKDKQHVLVNANDIIFDDAMMTQLKEAAGEVDILLCGYTGAGPYPQTYFELGDSRLVEEADKKKVAFFERYKKLINYINAKVNIPFAGKYVLGGKLTSLNSFRGVADPVEVLDFDSRAVVLEDLTGEINTQELVASNVRTEPYDVNFLDKRLAEISSKKMDYERLINEDEVYQLPIERLLRQAYHNAWKKSECTSDYFFVFSLRGKKIILNANSMSDPVFLVQDQNVEDLPFPRSEVILDIRYLFGLLTHVYHWNNAEVGSQILVRRNPNILSRTAQNFLNFLVV